MGWLSLKDSVATSTSSAYPSPTTVGVHYDLLVESDPFRRETRLR